MRGFTLLEILIYVALFSVLVTGFVSAAVVIGESTYRISALTRQLDEEGFILQRIRHVAEYASEIEITATENNNSLLTLTHGSDQTQYFSDGAKLYEKHVGAGVESTLVGSGVNVSSFICSTVRDDGPLAMHCLLTLSLTGGPGMELTETTTLTVYPANL